MSKDNDRMPPAPLAAPPDAAASRPAPGLSIVVPVYRGAATIGLLVAELSKLHPENGLEVVLVNDGSPDNSAEICRSLVRNAAVPVVYVEHARNYGEHNAVMTGLRHASGAFVITMDDDLQNPPEEVLKLYDHARLGGWDVVYTRFAVKAHAGWRNLGSRFANQVADWLLDKPRGLYLSSFRCMSELVVQSVTCYRGPYPYVDGLIMQVTQRIDSIEVRHLPRAEGRSNYTLRRLVLLWLNLATSFSLVPLRLAIFAGRGDGGAGRGRRHRHHYRGADDARHAKRLGLDHDRPPAGFRRAVHGARRDGRIYRSHLPLRQRQAAGHGAAGRTQRRRQRAAGRGMTPPPGGCGAQ